MKRLLPPMLFVICIAIMLLLHFFIPFLKVISYPINLLGILLLIAGLLISMNGSNKFKKIGTTVMTFDEPEKLVIDGLYKYTRNPMYLGFVLFLFGLSIFLGSSTPFLIVILFIIITNRWYIKFEESMLIKKFGNEYLSYKKKVRKWL